MRLETSNILGVGVNAINMEMAVEQIQNWIDAREQHYVCVTGVHGAMESQRDEHLRQIHNAAGLAFALAGVPAGGTGLRAGSSPGYLRAVDEIWLVTLFLWGRTRRS